MRIWTLWRKKLCSKFLCCTSLYIICATCRCQARLSSRRWRCNAARSRRRRKHLWPLDESVSGAPGRELRPEGCGGRTRDDEQRRECEESPRRASQSARQTAGVRGAERPAERALPEAAELSVQRAGETARLGLRLPRVRVSAPSPHYQFTCAALHESVQLSPVDLVRTDLYQDMWWMIPFCPLYNVTLDIFVYILGLPLTSLTWHKLMCAQC